MAFPLKIAALIIAIAMAVKAIPETELKPLPDHDPEKPNTISPHVSMMPSRRLSRFLRATRQGGINPRAAPNAADHCKKDNDVCNILGVGGKCCRNKCMDLSSDKNNCGACQNRCKFTHTCCNGQCVMAAFHNKHCGRCNNRCPEGQECIYGMCNYG